MSRSSSPDRGTLFKGVAIWLACASLGISLPSHLSISPTGSLRDHVFWLNRGIKPNQLKSGDIVMFLHANLATHFATRMLIKRIGCDEGETLTTGGNRDYYCNGRYLGRARDRLLNGSPAEYFVYNGPVPAGLMFVTGDHPDSFDSRYFGFVAKELVVAKAWPLF